MGLGCCSRFAKYILFAFNFLFWIVGAVLLGVGIWVLVDRNAIELLHVATVSTSDALVKGSAITLIVAGAFVFFVAFFGCFGACRESPCMLMTYAVIVGLVLVIQIVAGILIAVFKDQIAEELGSSMNETVKMRYGQPGFNETTDSYDYMQRSLECCGALNGPSDYSDSLWSAQSTDQIVPLTCCVLTNQFEYDEEPKPKNTAQCNIDALLPNATSEYINREGCQPKLYDWVVDNASMLLGVAFGLAIVQIIGVCLACVVANSKRAQYEYV